ncbi:RNA-directed DNA polymerase, eukaryota, reverse transcriptase zinc-binding domain protein [Tanacetum coccineum]
MPTEMELALEQTQQGVSYEVSNIRVNSFTMKMEILLEPTSNKLMVGSDPHGFEGLKDGVKITCFYNGNDCNPISSGNDGEVGSKEDMTKNISVENMNDKERTVTDSVTTEEVISNPNSHDNDNKGVNKKISYADMVSDNVQLGDNELFFVPTAINDKGEEVVLFEEELVKEGSEKWKYTVCGYFVGCRMGVNELRYNVRRMWGKFGLKDIVVDADGLCYFKFKQEDGMNLVIDQSPWLVNAGTGRLGYARVLVEINAEKSYIDNVEINYVDDLKKVKKTKWVEVEYSWKPERCGQCCVFGHGVNACKSKIRVNETVGPKDNVIKQRNEADKEGFVEVKNRRNVGDQRSMGNKGHQGTNQGFRKDRGSKKENVKFAYQPKVPVPKVQDNVSHDRVIMRI